MAAWHWVYGNLYISLPHSSGFFHSSGAAALGPPGTTARGQGCGKRSMPADCPCDLMMGMGDFWKKCLEDLVKWLVIQWTFYHRFKMIIFYMVPIWFPYGCH